MQVTQRMALMGLALLSLLAGSSTAETTPGAVATADRAGAIMQVLRDARSAHVLVAAHRGDWQNHPENSLAGVKSAIEMGCDIVEIDLRLTKDNQFVLMHDKTLDRTTTGTGKVSDHTLADLSSLRLRDSAGTITTEPVPTLEQVVELARGRVILYLDKTDDVLDKLHPVLVKLRAREFCLTYGRHTAEELRQRFWPYILEMNYLPKLGDGTKNVDAYYQSLVQDIRPPIVLVDFSTTSSPVVQQMAKIRADAIRVWASPLWQDIAGGITDTAALTDPDANWGWLLDRGVSVFCTDQPARLIAYLERRGRRLPILRP